MVPLLGCETRGLTRSRWGTECSVWDVRWGLLPGPTRAELGGDQGACVDGCRAGRRPGRLRALNRVIRYGLFPYFYSHRRLTTAFIRGPGDYVPAGRIGSDGSASGAEARQTHHCTHVVLQIWHMRRADIRLRHEDEPSLKHDQDLRANRPEHTRTQQAYVPQNLARQQRHAPDIQGILHSRAVELDTLFAHEAKLHWKARPRVPVSAAVHSHVITPLMRHRAFQYPYVLAFEPTFGNVEAGSMSQVIQGNHLRCLFTDTPPSLQQAYSRMSLSSYNGGGGSPGPGSGPMPLTHVPGNR